MNKSEFFVSFSLLDIDGRYLIVSSSKDAYEYTMYIYLRRKEEPFIKAKYFYGMIVIPDYILSVKEVIIYIKKEYYRIRNEMYQLARKEFPEGLRNVVSIIDLHGKRVVITEIIKEYTIYLIAKREREND